MVQPKFNLLRIFLEPVFFGLMIVGLLISMIYKPRGALALIDQWVTRTFYEG
jgi:hypothetical protein